MLQRVRLRIPPALAWAAAAPFALWAIARVAGLDGLAIAAQLLSFTPYVAAVSVLPVALAVLGRRWWAAGLALVACAMLAACVLPRAFGSASTMDGVPVTMMSMNMRYGGADVAAIMRVVSEQHVDVLAVQEFTPDAQRRLAEAGLPDLMPFQANHPVEGTLGSGLYSRFPLTDTGAVQNGGSFFQVHGVAAVPGAVPVTVESVHPVPPMTGNIADWKQDLLDEKPAGGLPRVLIGDFNSTLDHSQLRRLIDTGYHDAANSVGAALVPTWPYDGGRSRVTPKITIDHVLCDTRIGVTDFHAYTIPGTDHRAIVARILLPRA